MSKGAKTYIDAVIAAGAVALSSSFLYWRSNNLVHFSVFLVLFVAAAMLKCRVPGVTGTYSPVFFFALLGSATLSFSEVAVASAMAGVVQSIYRPKRRPALIQVCFNGANLTLSACAGLLVVQRRIPGLADQPLIILLILAATVVYFVNTALVSVVLMLVERGSFAQVWKHWCLGSLPYYIVGAMIVAGAINSENPVSAIGAVLLAPSILLTTIFYHLWLRPATQQPIQLQDVKHGS